MNKILKFYLFLILLIIPLILLNWQYENQLYCDFDCFYTAFRYENPYHSRCFVYLNYFIFLIPYFKFSRNIVILITTIIQLASLQIIYTIENNEKKFTKIWYILISFSVVFNYLWINADIIMLLGLVLYWKFRNNPFSPIFFVFVIFKPTSAIAIALILLIELKENPLFFKNRLKLVNLSVFALWSLWNFYISVQDGYLEDLFYGNTYVDFFFIRPTHYTWFLYPFKIMNDSNSFGDKFKKNTLNIVIILSLIIFLGSISLTLIRLQNDGIIGYFFQLLKI